MFFLFKYDLFNNEYMFIVIMQNNKQMKTIHQILNKIFPQKSTAEQGKTAFSGRLERSESYKKNYESWKSSGRIKEILSVLRKELEDSLHSGEPTNILGVHEGKGFTGIYMKNDDLLESREYPF